MFRISDFSRLTRVTVKTLRHYDRLGILRPAFVDPRSRYRSYSAAQVARLQRILALRDLGFTLENIAEILDQDRRGGTLRRLLERRRVEVARQLELDRRRLAQVDATLQDIERRRRPILPTTVLQEIPAVRVASRRSRVANLDDGVEELFEAVEADAARAAIRASGPPILLYHDRDHPATEADVEAAVPVVPHARQARGSKIRLLPAVPLAACVVYGGSYGQWSDVFRGLLAWLQSRRLAPSGPLREVYIQFGARNARSLALPRAYLADRAEDLVTEMQIPVRRGAPPGDGDSPAIASG